MGCYIRTSLHLYNKFCFSRKHVWLARQSKSLPTVACYLRHTILEVKSSTTRLGRIDVVVSSSGKQFAKTSACQPPSELHVRCVRSSSPTNPLQRRKMVSQLGEATARAVDKEDSFTKPVITIGIAGGTGAGKVSGAARETIVASCMALPC